MNEKLEEKFFGSNEKCISILLWPEKKILFFITAVYGCAMVTKIKVCC